MIRRADGRLVVIGGASRSGKTEFTKRLAEPESRIFAWDPEDQWAALKGWKRVTRRSDLLAAAKAPGPARVAYVAGGDLVEEFNFWAGCVFFSTRHVEATSAIAEELADVTTPSKAPGKWGILLRRGLKRGGNIYAISQRWAEADKTAMGNASAFVIFRQGTGPDAAYMAKRTRVPLPDIDSLAPLEFIFYDAGTGKIERSKLTF